MKNCLLIVLYFLFWTLDLSAQDVKEYYYVDKYEINQTENPKKAKFLKKVTISSDSIETNEFYKIAKKSNKLIYVEHLKDGMETGLWTYYDKSGNIQRQIDYSFEIKFAKQRFESTNYFEMRKLKTEIGNSDMISPTLISYPSLAKGIYTELRYPAYARINNIQGKVEINFKVTKDGKLEIIAVLDSSHPRLTRSAWLALSKCNDWEPATINGEKVDSYSVIPIYFRLEDN